MKWKLQDTVVMASDWGAQDGLESCVSNLHSEAGGDPVVSQYQRMRWGKALLNDI